MAEINDAHELDQIRETMQEKDTDELITIWRTRAHPEWTNEAYQVVESILIERLGGLPEPVETNEIEEGDTYHDPAEVEEITNRASTLSTLARVFAYLFVAAAVLVFFISILGSSSITRGILLNLIGTGAIILSVLFLALACGVFSIALKTFEEGLYLLRDIEEHTRPKSS